MLYRLKVGTIATHGAGHGAEVCVYIGGYISKPLAP